MGMDGVLHMKICVMSVHNMVLLKSVKSVEIEWFMTAHTGAELTVLRPPIGGCGLSLTG